MSYGRKITVVGNRTLAQALNRAADPTYHIAGVGHDASYREAVAATADLLVVDLPPKELRSWMPILKEAHCPVILANTGRSGDERLDRFLKRKGRTWFYNHRIQTAVAPKDVFRVLAQLHDAPDRHGLMPLNGRARAAVSKPALIPA